MKEIIFSLIFCFFCIKYFFGQDTIPNTSTNDIVRSISWIAVEKATQKSIQISKSSLEPKKEDTYMNLSNLSQSFDNDFWYSFELEINKNDEPTTINIYPLLNNTSEVLKLFCMDFYIETWVSTDKNIGNENIYSVFEYVDNIYSKNRKGSGKIFKYRYHPIVWSANWLRISPYQMDDNKIHSDNNLLFNNIEVALSKTIKNCKINIFVYIAKKSQDELNW
jgi:hypothetical protein